MRKTVFGRKKAPDKALRHSDDCKIVKADPSVQIEWSEIRLGVWEAVCQCGREIHYDPVADEREKLDPFDPATARHGPGCPYRDATEIPSGALQVDEKDGGYWWVTCHACSFSWQVPTYAPEASEAIEK